MASIYLKKIRLHNFRAYGPEFQLPLPHGPGVTVISGANGLGKSTVFEAVEWCLTGNILRLQKVNSKEWRRELLREGAGGVPKVELDFGSAGSLLRAGEDAPSTEAIRSFLRSLEWNGEIPDVGNYLRLTHFLPQSRRVQVIHEDYKDQWTILKALVGAERLESLRLRLGERRTTLAFTNAIETAKRDIEKAQAAILEWDLLIEEEQSIREIASAGAALSPEELKSVLISIEQELQKLLPITEGTGIDSNSGESDLPARLVSVERHIMELERSGQTLDALISNAEETLMQWRRLRKDTLERQATIDNLTGEHATAVKNQKDLQVEMKRLLDAIDIATLRKNDTTKRAEQLDSLLNALTVLRKLSRDIADTKAKLKIAGEALELLEKERTFSVAKHQERKSLVQQLESASGKRGIFERLHVEWERHIDAQEKARIAQQDLIATTGRIGDAEKDIAELGKESNLLEGQIAVLDSRLNEAQDSAKAIQQAVSQIAARLTEEQVCPVCAHAYPTPGVLKQLADASARIANTDFSIIAEELAAKRALRRQVVEKIHTAEQGLSILRQVANRLNEDIKIAKELWAALSQDQMIYPRTGGEIGLYIQAQLAEIANFESNCRLQLESFKSDDELTLELENIESKLWEQTRQREHLNRTLSEQNAQQDLQESTINHYRGLFPAVSESTEQLKSERERVEREAETIVRDIRALDKELSTIMEKKRVCDAQVHLFSSQLQEGKRELQELKESQSNYLSQWHQIASEGEPNEEDILRLRNERQTRQIAAPALRDSHSRALIGLERWNNNKRLGNLTQKIENYLTTENSTLQRSEYRNALEKMAQQAHRQLDRIETTQKFASTIRTGLQEEASDYTNAILGPLAGRLSAFHKMLSSFPDFSFDMLTRQHKTRTDYELTFNSNNQDHNPHLRLSEGQVSALGLTFLFAASTTYRWSRWRGLLLDDPLQHNDLIHTTAFLDVLRFLVSDEGFQVVLTTHDLDSAQFILRKCARAGIITQHCRLLGLSADGGVNAEFSYVQDSQAGL